MENDNILKTILKRIDLRLRQFEAFKENTTLTDAIGIIKKSMTSGNKVLVFGNGGSATQSSHFAAELVNKFYFQRKALPALALTTDTANLTSIANDMSYQAVFSRQVEALGKPGDVAIGISTSGRSANVLQALETARSVGMKTIALCGTFTTDLHKLGIDVIISIQEDDTPVIQEMHLFILHMMAEILEKELCEGA